MLYNISESSFLMVVLVVLTSSCRLHAWSPSLGEEVLSSPSSSLEKEEQLLHHSITRRAVFDVACKGFYDRKIWTKLNQACEDCQNVFRKHGLASDCRMGCFSSEAFPNCVGELLLSVKEYKDLAELIRG